MISVVVLQNCMALVKGEPGSCNDTCVTSVLRGNDIIGIEADMVPNMTEEEDQESTTVPVIKTEPTVSIVPLERDVHTSR